MTETTPVRADRRAWAGLALLTLPMLMVASDLTVLFFAMPAIGADLEPGPTQALWIVHVYGFLIAGFLVTMGRLGDRVGPRRLLLSGAAVFGLLSLIAAFSTSATMLIVVRALLGVAGATLMPSLFSLLRVMFTDDHQRRVAIAIMMSAFSIGGAIGPLLGGLLLEFFWWGSVFVLNVPFMVMLVALGPFLLPEHDEPDEPGRLDPLSVILSVGGILAVVYGLQEIAAGYENGSRTPWAEVTAIGAGLVLLTWFIGRQRRLRDPLFDLALLADRRITVALASILLVGIGMVGTYYLLTQYLQWVSGLSALHAAFWTIPYIVTSIVGFMVAPALAGRQRPAVIVLAGLTLAAFGLALTALVGAASQTAAPVMLAFAVTAFGQGMAFALLSDMIISSAPADRAGSAAAAQEVGGELGTAAGIAVGGAIGLVVYRAQVAAGLPADTPGTVRSAALDGLHALDDAEAATGPVVEVARQAFASGVMAYAWVGAALLTATAVLVAWTLVRPRRPRSAGSSSGEPGRRTSHDPTATRGRGVS